LLTSVPLMVKLPWVLAPMALCAVAITIMLLVLLPSVLSASATAIVPLLVTVPLTLP